MSLLRLLLPLAVVGLPAVANAHMVITSPAPRVSADNIKEANAPCGGPRGSVVHELTGGQMLTIEFDETIAHPGHFELKFSMAGDTRWQTLDAAIPDQGGVGSYSHTFQVPDVTCTDCTFQFIQVMTDRNPPVNYYNCIDVAITGTAMPEPDLGGAPDMGSAPPDMGTTPSNNTTTPPNNATPPGTTVPPDPSTPTPTPEPDAGAELHDVNGSGAACSVATGHAADGAWLALVVGALVTRVRRRSSRGSIAAR